MAFKISIGMSFIFLYNNSMENRKYTNKEIIQSIIHISLMVAIMVLCSWITIPFAIPFTMQTFAIFFSLLFLGGFQGTIAICLYLILGLVGVPVFSGFNAGFAYLVGPTGGYLISFVLMGIIQIIFDVFYKKNNKTIIKLIPLLVGLVVCYCLGTLWMCFILHTFTIQGIFDSMLIAVLPFVIPDIIKLWLVFFIDKRIRFLKIKKNDE